MSAVAIVINRLLAASSVTNIVGQRIFPITPPQGTQPPVIVVHLISTVDLGRTIHSAGDYFRSVVQLDCIFGADTPSNAAKTIELGEAVLAALNGIIKQEVAGCEDVDVLLDDGEDFTEYDELAKSFRRVIRVTVMWRRGS